MPEDPVATTTTNATKEKEAEPLTPEQLERIRKNRERALELQRQRKLCRIAPEDEEGRRTGDEHGAGGAAGSGTAPPLKRLKRTKVEEEDVELEDFEVGASEFVTKKEASTVYCLPEGTLAVCQFVERENPHRKGWTPMKLYVRAEIRRRARERFGGLDGLQHERRRREETRFLRDLEKTKDVFRNTSSR